MKGLRPFFGTQILFENIPVRITIIILQVDNLLVS
jgi:hypothetical protein